MDWTPIIIDGVLMTSHPEQQPGEFLLTNVSRPEDLESFDYQHKRLGRDAYDTHGNIVQGMYPVFVWQTEYEARNREKTVEIGH